MNTNFSIEETAIKEVKLITPFYAEDNRGYFLKSIEKDVFRDWGLCVEIFEDFESYSKKNVIRGLHFQIQNPQIKIVRAIKGVIHDVAVDLRKGSPTFGRYVDATLTEENHNSLWIPKGFAHGFEVLSEDAIVSYKCIGKYSKGTDSGICWNDVDVAVEWKTNTPVISERDATLMSLQTFIRKYGGLEEK